MWYSANFSHLVRVYFWFIISSDIWQLFTSHVWSIVSEIFLTRQHLLCLLWFIILAFFGKHTHRVCLLWFIVSAFFFGNYSHLVCLLWFIISSDIQQNFHILCVFTFDSLFLPIFGKFFTSRECLLLIYYFFQYSAIFHISCVINCFGISFHETPPRVFTLGYSRVLGSKI